MSLVWFSTAFLVLVAALALTVTRDKPGARGFRAAVLVIVFGGALIAAGEAVVGTGTLCVGVVALTVASARKALEDLGSSRQR